MRPRFRRSARTRVRETRGLLPRFETPPFGFKLKNAFEDSNFFFFYQLESNLNLPKATPSSLSRCEMVSPSKNVFLFELACSSGDCFDHSPAERLPLSTVHCVSGTLTVNVSVLLLSLASPDESSLVINK